MLIKLTDLLPSGLSGDKSLLPKQRDFLTSVLDPTSSKYIAYVGGVGSGKTIIGCLTMIAMAIQYPGIYLICRQYLPELKITTLKTFLDMCPKELIEEYRVADGIIRLKSVGNKTSDIIFRQLEEPDKLRSLNLSGFYIDESSQVSEEAFMLLQGRLRGPGLRKGFLTTNPNGHDWQYQWFVKQDHFNNKEIKKQFKLIRAPSTENIHLPDGYVQSMMATWSPERVKREIEGSFDAFEGMVYHEFRRDTHVIQPFAIPKEWIRVIGIDHGYRNPSAWIWGAIDYDENIYIYKEFYEKEWLIEEIVKGNPKKNKPGVLGMMKGEKITAAYIDPSTRAVRGATGLSDYDIYVDHLPKDFPLGLANNDVTAGIDRVKSFLQINPSTSKPKVFIFNTCSNLIEEMSKYRYVELTGQQQGKRSEREAPRKVDDHAVDAFRYLIMSRMGPPKTDDQVWKRLKYNSLEGSLYRDLKEKKNPKNIKDPWQDY